MRKLAVFFLPLFVAAATVIACSDDDNNTTPTVTPDAGKDTGTTTETPDTGSDTPVDAGTDAPVEAAATTGTMNVTVTYTGNKTGTLTLAYFTSPTSPPVDGAMVPAASPYPYSKAFTSVPPGTYFVYAFIDVSNTQETAPKSTDPQAADFVQVTIVAGQTAPVAITLQ